jgi:organic radical activating enzyme
VEKLAPQRRALQTMKPSNLRLYVTPEDYQVFAGPDWPAYDDFLQGDRSDILEIQQEIAEFVAMRKKEGIKFPISTKTACQSKWTWSTIYLNWLSTASCHRVSPVPFTLEEFDNFHNVPKKLQDRRLMLQGEWPTGGCEYCKVIEDAGGWSDRHHNLEIRDLTPPELEQNPTAIEVSPRIVEIFAQNTCNLQCTYCNSGLSSKIEQENRKFGEFDQGGVVIPVTTVPTATKEYFEKFMSWLDNNILTLKRLHLLGGETFIQHELMSRVLDVIERNPNPELQFCVFSNLNVPDKAWNLYIPRIQDLQHRGHIKIFDLTASIDCWGAEAEYARSGLDLKKFEERFAWAASQDESWLRLNANQTITCLTMKTMPEMIEKLAHYGKNRHIGHYFQFYTGLHPFQHPNIYAYDFWAETFDRIFAAMPTNTDAQREAVDRMEGMRKYLEVFSENNTEEITKLHIYLDELDRRRGTDWRSVFPYLNI